MVQKESDLQCFKHFKEGRQRWQTMLGGDQAEPSEFSISRKLTNCQCRQKINIIGNVS
jgi:hypothetical protein